MRLSLPPLLSLLLGCNRPAPGYPLDGAELVLGAATLDLGAVPLGGNTSATVEVMNIGNTSADVAAAIGAPFSLSDTTTSFEVGPGAAFYVEVRYAPTTYDPASATLTIQSATESFQVGVSASTDPDSDADGVDAIAAGGADCDDLDDTSYPGAVDDCYDGVDQDCDAVAGVDPEEVDCDGDGATLAGGDCNDVDPTVLPGAPEVEDGIDQDCDGLRDEDFRAAGELVVTEVRPGDGGWVELCNLTAGPIPVDGFEVSWSGGTAVLAGATVDVGACVAICERASDDCALESDFAIPADGGPLRVTVAGLVVDEVPLDRAWGWSLGQVYSLEPQAYDATANDQQGAWCPTHGSPGAVNPRTCT